MFRADVQFLFARVIIVICSITNNDCHVTCSVRVGVWRHWSSCVVSSYDVPTPEVLVLLFPLHPKTLPSRLFNEPTRQ